MDITSPDKLADIRRLNDEFRTTFRGGEVFLTHGVATLPSEIIASAFLKVSEFSDWTPEIDESGEHDYLSFDLCNREFVFVIQYWDKDLKDPSPDPADPAVTRRIAFLTTTYEWRV